MNISTYSWYKHESQLPPLYPASLASNSGAYAVLNLFCLNRCISAGVCENSVPNVPARITRRIDVNKYDPALMSVAYIRIFTHLGPLSITALPLKSPLHYMPDFINFGHTATASVNHEILLNV